MELWQKRQKNNYIEEKLFLINFGEHLTQSKPNADKQERIYSNENCQRMISINVKECKDDKHIYIYKCPNFERMCKKDDFDDIKGNAIKLAFYWTYNI